MIDDDLSVFYDAADFGTPFTRWNGYTPSVEFVGIFAVADQEALESFAITAQYELQYPTAAVVLKPDDELRTTQPGIAGRYRVRGAPMRVNDGRESKVLLSLIAAAP